MKYSEERNKKISESHKGIKFSEERKRKISEALKGRKISEQTRIKISKALRGKKQPYIHRGGCEKGHIVKPETREKIRQSHFGKKHTLEQIEKIRLVRIGKHHTPETIMKMREIHSGNKSSFWRGGVTPETNKRISSFRWKELRKKIYERDMWTCQICGKHCHNDIQCHHIIPYRISKDDSSENLQTLCRSCHMKVEFAFIIKNCFNNDGWRKLRGD